MNQNNEKCPEIETPVTEDVINRTLHEWMERGCWHEALHQASFPLLCKKCGINSWTALVPFANQRVDYMSEESPRRLLNEVEIKAVEVFGDQYIDTLFEVLAPMDHWKKVTLATADQRARAIYRLIQQEKTK